MKKRIIIIAAVAIVSEIIAISVVLGLFTFWLGNETIVNADNTNHTYNDVNNCINYENNDTLYNIKAYVGLSDDIVIIKESIKLDNSDKTNSNKINGNNHQVNNEVNEKVYLYVPSLNVANTTINNIYVENEHSELITIENWDINRLVLEIQIPLDGDKNKVCDKIQTGKISYIHIEYEISLNKNTGTISHSNNQILLTNFLITPAVYKEDKPILLYSSTFGDPYIYESNNYHIIFNIDENMDVFAPGKKEAQNSDTNTDNEQLNNQTIIFKADNMRDFPAVITKNSKNNTNGYNLLNNNVHIEKINNTEIYFINSKDAVKYVREAFLFANKKIGPYPYQKLFVVKASIPLKGMEFSNMIFVSEKCFNDRNDLRRVLYHEIFHQWFYGIIGTDQVNEPFMDEGIVNYLAIMLNGDKLNSNYSNEFFNKELKDYSSKDEYYRLAYTDAAIYFSNIHKKLGNGFYELLKKIYNDKKYKILYFNEFEQYLTDLKVVLE
jgi:hypothetical protein